MKKKSCSKSYGGEMAEGKGWRKDQGAEVVDENHGDRLMEEYSRRMICGKEFIEEESGRGRHGEGNHGGESIHKKS